jgi:regulator of protease activity HflC (stomatin/prohibitin superfamily)
MFTLFDFVIIATVVAILVWIVCLVIIPEGAVAVTEMFGVRWRTLGCGPHVLVPFVERRRGVSWTTFRNNARGVEYTRLIPTNLQTLDPPPLPVTCDGRIVIEVDTILRWRIVNPVTACYNSADLPADLYEQLRSALSDVAARTSIDELVKRPSAISDAVRTAMTPFCEASGIVLSEILVQGIRYPTAIEAATHGQVAKRIESEAALFAQQNQQKLDMCKARHASELRGVENETLIAKARAENEASIAKARAQLEACKLEAEGITVKAKAASAAEKEKLVAIASCGMPVPPDYLSAVKYSEAWAALAAAPNVQKVVIPYGAVPFLGSTGVFVDARAHQLSQ